MNRLIKVASRVEADPEAMEKLLVTQSDFLYALQNDIKPAFGTDDVLERFLARGIIDWGTPVNSILQDGMLFVQLACSTDTSGLVSILLEGPRNSGKTALAAQLAKKSGFPLVKVCTPRDVLGFTESAKCLHIRKMFDDAYHSQLSCILMNDIEDLLDYGPIGPRYSNLTLQTLRVLLKEDPPNGQKLLILCTSSCRKVLEDLEMLSAFTAILHVPNMSEEEHLKAVLEQSKVFSNEDLSSIYQKIHGHRVFIGIKKLLALIAMARQTEEQNRVVKFLTKLEEEGLDMSSPIH